MNYGVFKPGVIHSSEHKQSKTRDEPHNIEQKTQSITVDQTRQNVGSKDGNYPSGWGNSGKRSVRRASWMLLEHICCLWIVTELCTYDACMLAKSLQLCPTLCDPMDCGLPGSSVHGISQTRILEWVATSFFRGSSNPRTKPVSSAWPVDSLPLSHLGSPQKVLGWPKSLYGFFCNILWKNSLWWTQYNATDFVLATYVA